MEGITLWMLGGLAQLKGRARAPGAEFRVAAIGPATSLLAAAVFAGVSWASVAGGAESLWTGVLAYLAFINVLLAEFNLVPAVPLDGGRILRSALWAAWGDPHRATAWSSRIGRGFGFALILLGALWLFTGLTTGLWWILIGLFIVTMASAEQRQSSVSAAPEGLRVTDVMSARPDTVDAGMSVGAFLRDVAMVRRHSAFPLVEQSGAVRGVIMLSRLKNVPADQCDSTPLREVACAPHEIPTAQPDDPLPDLLSRMNGCTDGRALVFENERLVGIVSPSDISRAVALHGVSTPR